MAEQYTYAVARIHAKEVSLLNGQDLEQLLGCKSADEVTACLADKGFDCGSGDTADDIVGREREKTLKLISEVVGDMSDFDIFLYENDYHNLKAAVKSVVTKENPERIFVGDGTVPSEVIKSAVAERDYTALPPRMAEAAEEAVHVLLETGDGGLCDMLIDKAYLDAVRTAGDDSDSPMIKSYAELTVALADIRIASRGARLGKGAEFFRKSLAECAKLDVSSLGTAAAKGMDELLEYIACTDYSNAADALRESQTALEKWCDDRLMEEIRKERFNQFTIAPIAAYFMARESELKAVRLILTGKQNRLDDSIIRERLRMLYV